LGCCVCYCVFFISSRRRHTRSKRDWSSGVCSSDLAITVGQFFQDEELEFSRYDDISHSDIAILDDDIEIEVTSAVPVELNDGGEKEKVWTTEDTVEDFLENEE